MGLEGDVSGTRLGREWDASGTRVGRERAPSHRRCAQGTKALVAAASAAGVRHFLMVSSLGTGRFGFPASLLNLFWEARLHALPLLVAEPLAVRAGQLFWPCGARGGPSAENQQT